MNDVDLVPVCFDSLLSGDNRDKERSEKEKKQEERINPNSLAVTKPNLLMS